MKLKLLQLIAPTPAQETQVYINGVAHPYSYAWVFKTGAMKKIATYADSIGPSLAMLFSTNSTPNNIKTSSLTAEAHRANLAVHP
jgi:glycerophosphoryl diester phosphodiesterase